MEQLWIENPEFLGNNMKITRRQLADIIAKEMGVLTDQMRVGYSTESVLQAFGKWIKRKESEQLRSYRGGAGR